MAKNWPIGHLPGLSADHCAQLMHQGIQTTRQLLEKTRSQPQKQQLATQLQIHIQHVLKWAALADLARIPAVGCQYCGLLLHSGIASSSQLGQMPVHRVHRQILKFYVATFQREDLCPPLEEVVVWINQARSLGTGY
ncbi:MAG TPA: DUF4332 domain-containing protein [Chroococcidiopsis sp.]